MLRPNSDHWMILVSTLVPCYNNKYNCTNVLGGGGGDIWLYMLRRHSDHWMIQVSILLGPWYINAPSLTVCSTFRTNSPSFTGYGKWFLQIVDREF